MSCLAGFPSYCFSLSWPESNLLLASLLLLTQSLPSSVQSHYPNLSPRFSTTCFFFFSLLKRTLNFSGSDSTSWPPFAISYIANLQICVSWRLSSQKQDSDWPHSYFLATPLSWLAMAYLSVNDMSTMPAYQRSRGGRTDYSCYLVNSSIAINILFNLRYDHGILLGKIL